MPSLPRGSLDPALDARLVARCREGDAAAWAALVRRYERLVYAVARGYRLADEDVADVFQEVFAALVRGLPRLRDGRTLCRWLASTTDRIALATALRRRRERAREGAPATGFEALPDDASPVGQDLEALESAMRVRLALGALAPACRNLLEALYYRDPSPAYRDLASELGIPIGSIGPTRARCLEKLERALRALESEPERISAPEPPTSFPEKGGGALRHSIVPGAPRPAASREDVPHVS